MEGLYVLGMGGKLDLVFRNCCIELLQNQGQCFRVLSTGRTVLLLLVRLLEPRLNRGRFVSKRLEFLQRQVSRRKVQLREREHSIRVNSKRSPEGAKRIP